MADIVRTQSDLSFLKLRKAGRYFGPFLTGSALTTQSLASANSLRAFPFYVTKAMKIDRIALNVTAQGTGTTPRARLGIYEDDGTIYPGKLVLDAGEINVSTTGVKQLTIDQALKSGKLYWLVLVGQDTASLTSSAIPVASAFATYIGFDATLTGTPILGYAVAQTYGALPATYPASATEWSLPVPLIAVRKV